MYCKECGTPNVDDARFCCNCGAELSTVTSPAPSPQMPPQSPQAPPPPQTPPQTPPQPTQAPPPGPQMPPQAPPYTPQTPPTSPKKSSGGGTCLGCGCAAVVVFLLIIGGLCWWGYDFYKKHNESLDEVLQWVDQNHAEWEEQHGTGNEDPDTLMYEGETLRQQAEENDFPSVTYDDDDEEENTDE